MAFRHNVEKEARLHLKLKSEGKPIPPEHRIYARKSGLIVTLVGAAGFLAIWAIYAWSARIYVGMFLFTAVIAIMGLLQLITGKHLITTRKYD